MYRVGLYHVFFVSGFRFQVRILKLEVRKSFFTNYSLSMPEIR